MATITNYLRAEAIAVVSEQPTSATISFLTVIPGTATRTLLYSGDEVIIVCKTTGNSYPLTLDADFDFNSTRLQFNSVTLDEVVPLGSYIVLSKDYKWNSLFRKNSLNHLRLYQQGNTHGNDLFMSATDYNFDITSGAILADGDSLNNNVGARYGFFNAPHNGCQVERINYKFNTDAGAGEIFVFSLWKKPVTENGTTATQLTLIDSYSMTSQDDSSYVFSASITPSLADGALNANDVIIPSIKKEGTKVSSTKLYGDIEILTSFDPRTSVI
jgi:hypothetical protein